MDSQRLRWTIYAIFISAAIGGSLGRIMSVANERGDSPMLSANDRSRWCAIRAMTDYGTYAIDDVLGQRSPYSKKNIWHTIDKVRHRGPDGRLHDYSSKPPLFPTMLAWVYHVIKTTTHATLAERPFYVVRLMLILVNVIPFACFLISFTRRVEQWGETDLGRILAVAVVSQATLMSPFIVTLNNHLPAAFCAWFSLNVAISVWRKEAVSWWGFAWCGLCAAFTAANELPALSLLAAIGVALIWRDWLKTLTLYVPAVAVVAAAFFYTNQNAHQSWRPPYAHRRDGTLVKEIKLPQWQKMFREAQGAVPSYAHDNLFLLRSELINDLIDAGLPLEGQVYLRQRQQPDHWMIRDRNDLQYAVQLVDETLVVREWDNWYDYEGSYWISEDRQGVDAGEPSRWWYAFNALVGHHGLFSLTPVWLFSIWGAMLYWQPDRKMRGVVVFVTAVSLVCFAFYMARPEIDRNYGGVSCGLRWMLWFTPMWCIFLIPACDRLSQSKWLRGLFVVAFAVSFFSATRPGLNPWHHPWMYDYWSYLGWPL